MVEVMMAFPLRSEPDRLGTAPAAPSEFPAGHSRLVDSRSADEPCEPVIEGEWCEADSDWTAASARSAVTDAIEVQWWESKPQAPANPHTPAMQCLRTVAGVAAIALTAGAGAEVVTQAVPDAGQRPVSLQPIAPAASVPSSADNILTRSHSHRPDPIAPPEVIRAPWLGQSTPLSAPNLGLALGAGVLLSIGMGVASDQRQLNQQASGQRRFANTIIGVVGC